MADSFLFPNGVEKDSLVCAPNVVVTLSVANVGTESGPAAALVRHLYYRPVTQEDNTEMNVTRYGSEDSESTSITLLDRVRLSEPYAWEQMVTLYAPVIYARCRRRWNLNQADAEQVGQEVFVAVARKVREFKRARKGSFRAWLSIIVDNKCKDFFRREPPVHTIGGTTLQNMLAAVADQEYQADEESGAEQGDEKAILMKQAMKCVEGEFSKRDWMIFWSVSVDEKNRKDLAESLSVSDNVVYLACSRIRRRLKEIYEDLLDEDLLGED